MNFFYVFLLNLKINKRQKSEIGNAISSFFQPDKTKQMSFKFEKLLIWQKSMDFGEQIFKLSQSFPKDEAFNLTSQ